MNAKVFYELEKLVPIKAGMRLDLALEIILKELIRLKEIEAMYEGLCK